MKSDVWWVVACGSLLWGCETDGTVVTTLTPPDAASPDPDGVPDAATDAAAGGDAARDAAAEPDSSVGLDADTPLVCSPLDCAPSLACQSQPELVAEVNRRCRQPPFVRGVTEGTACDASFVRYEYGASDVAIAFFDPTSLELRGYWNQSDTGEQSCAGDVDAACALALHRSLPEPDDEGCPPDAGADAAADSGSLAADGG